MCFTLLDFKHPRSILIIAEESDEERMSAIVEAGVCMDDSSPLNLNDSNDREVEESIGVVSSEPDLPMMRFKRFRNREQVRDDHDKIPMLRRNGEDSACSLEETGEAVKKLYESIILDDNIEEAVECCVSDSVSFSVSLPSLDSQSLSSTSENIPPNTIDDAASDRQKTVSFSEPMVTCSWSIPKVESADVDRLFYSSLDYQKFKLDRNDVEPTAKVRDKEYVDQLVQNLDRMGAESFARGDYIQALVAFKHSLRVKTDTFSEYDNVRSTSATIHCIADVYSKTLKWDRALDTYQAAYEILSRLDSFEEDKDAKRWASVLLYKIKRVQGQMELAQATSRDSI